MRQEIKDMMLGDIALFAEKIHAYEAGEVDKKAYKGFSGGFGSYPQRNGGYMLRLRMSGGRLTKERLEFFARSVEEYEVERLKLTTCQTIQMHNLPAQTTVELMAKAVDVDIITRGGGGDFTRNTMASPLSGVEQGEYFDVMPWAEAAGEYMLGFVRDLKLPRKLKVAFSNSPANSTHATFRDLGFVAREDGRFDVYCAGGLGPNPRLGVKVMERLEPELCGACIDAMLSVFKTFGNYENRAKSRTRYLQEMLGVDGLKAEFVKAFEETKKTSPRLMIQETVVDKSPTGTVAGPRVIHQKQEGLYAVSYHPKGGNLPAGKPRVLYETIREMPFVEGRIAPDGTLYFINLTAEEAQKVLAVTQDSALSPFQCSVSCIGGTICSTGVRDSQGVLAAMMEAVEEAGLSDRALPAVHVSGCPSSCGTQQVGALGFQGGAKLVDGVSQPAFMLSVKGCEVQGQEYLGENLGMMLQSDIPAFIVELGRLVDETGMEFHAWLSEREEDFRALADKYING